MDQFLIRRLCILQNSGEIDEAVKQTVLEFCECFEKRYSLRMDEGNASMFVTHIAMALARIKRGEELNSMEDAILSEVKSNRVYGELLDFYKLIESTLDIVICESEKGFIALHASALIENTVRGGL